MDEQEPKRLMYPLLEALLAEKGLRLKGTYTYADASQILGGSKRALQALIQDGKLRSRNLPARAKFLSTDLETFLQDSLTVKARQPREDRPNALYRAQRTRSSPSR